MSHNAALHGWCDTFEKVRRGASGTEALVMNGGGSTGGLDGAGHCSGGARSGGKGHAKVRKVAVQL